jgi:hypothetical protein
MSAPVRTIQPPSYLSASKHRHYTVLFFKHFLMFNNNCIDLWRAHDFFDVNIHCGMILLNRSLPGMISACDPGASGLKEAGLALPRPHRC